MNVEQKMHYVLRLAVAMCFIGHGAFGIIGKEIWCNYFAVFGIGKDTAYSLMPWVGALDIALGVTMLIYPLRAIAVWLVMWGVFTALLRPLSGEPVAEVIERAGNFGAPLALLILSGGIRNVKHLFTPINPDQKVDTKSLEAATVCLRMVVFLLLTGHGWLNLLEKKGLLNQYAALGFAKPGLVALMVGSFEMAAALIILIKPVRYVLIMLFVWKMGTELFYPHYEVFEWIERGGSYCSILAVIIAFTNSPLYTASSKRTELNQQSIN